MTVEKNAGSDAADGKLVDSGTVDGGPTDGEPGDNGTDDRGPGDREPGDGRPAAISPALLLMMLGRQVREKTDAELRNQGSVSYTHLTLPTN